MLSSAPRRTYTDGQLKNQLTRLDADKQHEFLRYSDPFFEKESEIYLDALSQSRAALAQALAQIRNELNADEENEDEDDNADDAENLGAKAGLFDTSTEMGKHMAAISVAFSELLEDSELEDTRVRKKAERAEAKAMKQYLKNLNDDETDEIEDEQSTGKRKRSGKKKHRKGKSGSVQSEYDELINTMKENLASELSTAAKKEQEAIMEKMKSHGQNIDSERKRQNDRLNERIREAREKKSLAADTVHADVVDNLMDRRDELDDIHQKDRSRQEKALMDRLKNRKHSESTNQEPESTLIGDGETEQETTNRKNKKHSKRGNKNHDLGNAEEQMEANTEAVIEPSTQTTVNELDDVERKKKRKKEKKNRSAEDGQSQLDDTIEM